MNTVPTEENKLKNAFKLETKKNVSKEELV
jgi:hypothetical protein